MLGTQAGDSEQFLTKLKTDTAFLMAQLKKKKKEGGICSNNNSEKCAPYGLISSLLLPFLRIGMKEYFPSPFGKADPPFLAKVKCCCVKSWVES